MSDNVELLLVGTGYMGKEYSKVLRELNVSHVAICRSEKSADVFFTETGIKAFSGGVKAAIDSFSTIPRTAIVAVNVDQLAETAITLIEAGVKELLIEKPAGLNKCEIERVSACANRFDASVYVGYNRRFYASTEKALEIIAKDGGVSSFCFEFTEWGYRIADTPHDPIVKEEWLLANSSHVIDLAFFLGGEPTEISSYSLGELSWHSRGSKYAGAGITRNNAIFSYQANWDAPGRWAVEVMTCEHRLYFKPMEKLYIQNKGSVMVEEVNIDDKYDVDFKPGLYKQTRAFLSNEKDFRLLTIEDQVKHMSIYEKIEGLV